MTLILLNLLMMRMKQILNVLQDVVGGFEYEIRNNEITLIKKEGGR